MSKRHKHGLLELEVRDTSNLPPFIYMYWPNRLFSGSLCNLAVKTTHIFYHLPNHLEVHYGIAEFLLVLHLSTVVDNFIWNFSWNLSQQEIFSGRHESSQSAKPHRNSYSNISYSIFPGFSINSCSSISS